MIDPNKKYNPLEDDDLPEDWDLDEEEDDPFWPDDLDFDFEEDDLEDEDF